MGCGGRTRSGTVQETRSWTWTDWSWWWATAQSSGRIARLRNSGQVEGGQGSTGCFGSLQGPSSSPRRPWFSQSRRSMVRRPQDAPGADRGTGSFRDTVNPERCTARGCWRPLLRGCVSRLGCAFGVWGFPVIFGTRPMESEREGERERERRLVELIHAHRARGSGRRAAGVIRSNCPVGHNRLVEASRLGCMAAAAAAADARGCAQRD